MLDTGLIAILEYSGWLVPFWLFDRRCEYLVSGDWTRLAGKVFLVWWYSQLQTSIYKGISQLAMFYHQHQNNVGYNYNLHLIQSKSKYSFNLIVSHVELVEVSQVD